MARGSATFSSNRRRAAGPTPGSRLRANQARRRSVESVSMAGLGRESGWGRWGEDGMPPGRAATRRTSGIADLVHDGQLALGIENDTVAHAIIDAEHHQQTGTLIGQAHAFVLDAVADQFTGLVDGQDIAFLEVVAGALVEDDHVILTD